MYTIGRAARLSEVSPDTLRYYEKEGLVMPVSKSPAGYRQYHDTDLQRIRFIKRAQHCGFTLSEIKELLALKVAERACCEDVRILAIEKKLQIERKLKALQALSRALDDLIRSCKGGERKADECPILGTLERSLEEVPG